MSWSQEELVAAAYAVVFFFVLVYVAIIAAKLARLQREVTVPIVALQDVWLDGPRLAEEMASLMAVEGAA